MPGADPRLAPDWETSVAGLLESREWCTQAVRRARGEEEAQRRAELQPGRPQPDPEPDTVMERAQERVVLRWARQLQAEGDEAALALADFLLTGAPTEQVGARERLVERAQRSSQGFVISLALQRCALDSVCNSLARRWTQQEPDNAAAWLHSGGVLTPAEVLRGVQAATRAQDYRLTLAARLLGLAQAPSVGLRDAAELQLMFGMSAAWALPRWAPLLKHCRALPQASECVGSADRLWRLEDPQLINRILSIKLAGEQARQSPEWHARAAEAEAISQWSLERSELELAAWHSVDSCDPSQGFGAWLRVRLAQGEWPRLVADMREQRQSVAELAERRRLRTGRSLLDPPKP
ncbi:hypothetical protein [Inhella sp.]|uniref:hypothetical protein n=1 Tax=Inhella sp. TaxID=1921806 RepID=UPI0035B144AA